MKLNLSTAVACATILIAMTPFTDAEAKQMVLNCEIENVAQDVEMLPGVKSTLSVDARTEILIDEEQAQIIYGAAAAAVNARMNITKSHPNLIIAKGDLETIVITKSDGRFLYVGYFLTGSNGNFNVSATIQRGRCLANPFPAIGLADPKYLMIYDFGRTSCGNWIDARAARQNVYDQRFVQAREWTSVPRDNQGETAASIRMRMRRGWTAVARA